MARSSGGGEAWGRLGGGRGCGLGPPRGTNKDARASMAPGLAIADVDRYADPNT